MNEDLKFYLDQAEAIGRRADMIRERALKEKVDFSAGVTLLKEAERSLNYEVACLVEGRKKAGDDNLVDNMDKA